MAGNLFRWSELLSPYPEPLQEYPQYSYKNSLSDNVVSCIVEDKDKNLWIGTNDGGLNLYNPITQRFTSYTLQEDESARGIGSNNIKAVYVDKRNLWYI